jgi:predicted metal-dependent hydrolase
VADPASLDRMSLPVEVVRSARRQKTIQAFVTDGKIRVHVPAWLSAEEERAHVDALVRRLSRQYRSQHIDLGARAASLATRYRLPRPATVVWSDRQRSRWGSCSPATGEVRLSRRLAEWPSWVLDYVIVHELAHLVEANHSPAFHALVNRYPRAERARGFLLAKGLYGDEGEETPADESTGDLPDDLPGDLDPVDGAGGRAVSTPVAPAAHVPAAASRGDRQGARRARRAGGTRDR